MNLAPSASVSIPTRHVTNHYRMREWKQFRAERLELDGHACVRCGGKTENGVILQVHHARYIRGRKPWEYAADDCETLCKGCHAVEHGLVCPSFGWECFDDEDLGDLCGTCEYCGNDLRYLFFVSHPNWEPMAVGAICCDHLTDTDAASCKMESIHRAQSRLARFLESPRWQCLSGLSKIRQRRIDLEIQPVGEVFRICLDGIEGRKTHQTVEDAKRAAFDFIESGQAEQFLQNRRLRA